MYTRSFWFGVLAEDQKGFIFSVRLQKNGEEKTSFSSWSFSFLGYFLTKKQCVTFAAIFCFYGGGLVLFQS